MEVRQNGCSGLCGILIRKFDGRRQPRTDLHSPLCKPAQGSRPASSRLYLQMDPRRGRSVILGSLLERQTLQQNFELRFFLPPSPPAEKAKKSPRLEQACQGLKGWDIRSLAKSNDHRQPA